ncbi:hypothetical protein PCE1_002984 [Barthelona sp. PCE]
MVKSSNTKKIVKKRTAAFKRFQSDRFMRVGSSWRKPHGIDGAFRRRFRGVGCKHVSIGFGSDKKTKYLAPNGLYRFVVHNVKDLAVLKTNTEICSAEIAHAVSAKKRVEIIKAAKEWGIYVTNAQARVRGNETN